MKSDAQLLSEFCRARSQDAFSQLLARHRPLVVATCLRELHDKSAAEDATQIVFLLLVKKAGGLKNRDSLAGWLFQSARWVCKNMRKQEQIRIKHEQQELQERASPEAAQWVEVESALNEGLASLGGSDREAILLRYFEGMTFAEIGSRVGAGEDATRMRTSRAVGKLRAYFAVRGIVLETNAFVTLLVTKCLVTQDAVQPPYPAPSARISEVTHRMIRTMAINQFKTASLVTALGMVMAGSVYKTAVKAAPTDTQPQSQASFAEPPKVTTTLHGTFTLLHSFSGMDGKGSNNGLVEATNGVLYGSTERGGKYDDGVLFSLNPDGNYTVLHDFTGASDGMCPGGVLLLGDDHCLYGTATGSSGQNADRVTFKITPSGTYSVLSEVTDSSNSIHTIWYQQDQSGDYYALSHRPDAGSQAPFFEMSGSAVPDPLFKLVYGKSGYIPLRGAQWVSPPNKNGDLYMFLATPSNPKGQIVEYRHSSHTPTVLYSFSGPDGNNPRSFIKGTDGSYYGTTSLGGPENDGVVFKWTPAG